MSLRPSPSDSSFNNGQSNLNNGQPSFNYGTGGFSNNNGYPKPGTGGNLGGNPGGNLGGDMGQYPLASLQPSASMGVMPSARQQALMPTPLPRAGERMNPGGMGRFRRLLMYPLTMECAAVVCLPPLSLSRCPPCPTH